MIKLTETKVYGWEPAIRGMRNPMNSWDKSDSKFDAVYYGDNGIELEHYDVIIGDNDHELMSKLRNAGPDHRKYMRMITVYVDITAPLYWWKEFDTYKVGTVANSCSTMHKIHAKKFTLEDFSTDRIFETDNGWIKGEYGEHDLSPFTFFEGIVHQLNVYRYWYNETKDKVWWDQMIQLLPSSYNQKRTVMLNYEVLLNMYHARKNHKLDEWREFCKWVETLPYSELITG